MCSFLQEFLKINLYHILMKFEKIYQNIDSLDFWNLIVFSFVNIIQEHRNDDFYSIFFTKLIFCFYLELIKKKLYQFSFLRQKSLFNFLL